MIPTIAIVGRPNVGKSTLFNRLTGRRGAIVENSPGVTRDRNYGEGEIINRKVIVVDTGGFEPETDDQMLVAMREQAEIAMDEADVILCVFDGPSGPLPQDHDIVRLLERLKTKSGPKPVFWVVNKIDGVRHEQLVPTFYELGVDELFPVSAQHNNGILDLVEAIDEVLPPAEEGDEEADPDVIKVAIVGRPNVGKSTLLNRLIGEQRMIVSNVPGTTRDSIDTRWERTREDGTVQRYLLIDTAGVRRRKWIRTTVEKISIVRTFKSIDRAQVCLLVLDATEGVSDQDARLAGLISDKGRACVILLNKWDAIADKDNATFGEHIKLVQDKLDFMKWAPIVTISGLTGQRTHKIMEEVDHAWQSFHRRVPTGELNRVFEQILHVHQPPVIKNRRLKLYYATEVQVAPPVFILWCNDPTGLHFSYKRFLVNRFREHWDFTGSPIKIAARARNRRSPAPVDDTAREQETREVLVAEPLGEADWQVDRIVPDAEEDTLE